MASVVSKRSSGLRLANCKRPRTVCCAGVDIREPGNGGAASQDQMVQNSMSKQIVQVFLFRQADLCSTGAKMRNKN
jgi:hypothetical protein